MAARTTAAAAADVVIEQAHTFGGNNGKKRKRVTVILKGSTSTSTVDTPWTVGADVGDLLASVMDLTKIEDCSNLMIYTTSTGAPLRIHSAAPDLAGTSVILSDSGQTAGAKADMSLTYQESARITLIGY